MEYEEENEVAKVILESVLHFDVIFLSKYFRMDESAIMEKHEITMEDLEKMAASMAQALPDLECPERCIVDCRHKYVELSAALYRDEWEWSYFAAVLVHYREQRKSGGGGSS